jgi:hypothetical protein
MTLSRGQFHESNRLILPSAATVLLLWRGAGVWTFCLLDLRACAQFLLSPFGI